MLKRSERQSGQPEVRHEPECMFHVELAHVSLQQSDPRSGVHRVMRQLFVAARKHCGTGVYTDNLNARPSRRNEYSPRAASDLEHATAGLLRQLHEERNILTLAIGHNIVVELGAEFVLIVAQRNIHVTSQY